MAALLFFHDKYHYFVNIPPESPKSAKKMKKKLEKWGIPVYN